MKSKTLIRKLYKKFPLSIAKKYHDHTGCMLNTHKEEFNKIILCLDVTKKVVEEAINNNVDVIISHHPFLYGKKKYILATNDYKKELYDKLFLNNISVYSFHTNFDEAKDGMNDALASLLELNDITPIEDIPMARKGYLTKPMEIHEFSKYALEKLSLDYGQLISNGKQYISSVAIFGGSGSSNAIKALNEGIDIFLSGDTPYHIRKELQERNLNYLHVDHEIEVAFCNQMKKILLSFDKNLDIKIVNDVKQIELIIR